MQIFGYGWPSAEKIFGEGGADGRPPQRLRPALPSPLCGHSPLGLYSSGARPCARHSLRARVCGTNQGGMGPLCLWSALPPPLCGRSVVYRPPGQCSALRGASLPRPPACCRAGYATLRPPSFMHGWGSGRSASLMACAPPVCLVLPLSLVRARVLGPAHRGPIPP